MPTPKQPPQQSDPIRSMQETNTVLKGYLSKIEAVKENQTLEQLYRDLDVQLTKSAAVARQGREYADKLLSACQESAAIIESISVAMKKRIEALNGEIHGYNVRLKQVNAKAEKVLEKIDCVRHALRVVYRLRCPISYVPNPIDCRLG